MTALPDDLLAAVLNMPDEDAPRLVAADWLEENGDAARAEFVRVQVAFANEPKCPSCDGMGFHRYPDFGDGSPNYSDSAACYRCDGCGWLNFDKVRVLRRRERELLDGHRLKWAGCRIPSIRSPSTAASSSASAAPRPTGSNTATRC